MTATPFVFQISGYSNTGKTTLMTELIHRFEHAGIRVGVLKHDGAHDFELDQPGKDTHRFSAAGASFVAIQSAAKSALIQRGSLSPDELIQRLADAGAELILVEGYKRERYPKLVLLREQSHTALLTELSNVVGAVSWFAFRHEGLPVFGIDDVDSIYELIHNRFLAHR
ncbi:UNVERIFIED_CONTAM: molybdopterin-guanine dinucleotide biosynthesis protein B [Brevibacillus sp. OAP136]